MKKFLFIVLSALILYACTQSQESKVSTEPSIETLNSILTIPVDSLSIEQKEEMLELFKIMDEKIEIEGDRFALKATEKDFEAKGVNLYYFNMLKKDVSDMNTSIKNDGFENSGFENIEEIFNETKRKLKIAIENLSS